MRVRILAGILFVLPLLSPAVHADSPAVPNLPITATVSAPIEDLDALKKSANAAMDSDDWPKALALWERYLALKPNDARGHRQRGWLLQKFGRDDEASAAFRKSTELEPNNSGGWTGLCWTQILLNRPLDARPACEKALSLNKTSFANLVNLGHTYLLTGDTKTADYWYHETLRNIKSEKDLKEGPLADFDIFIARGWQVEASHKAKAWLEQEATTWLALRTQATEIIAQAKAVGKQEDLVAMIAGLKEITPLLEELYGTESQLVGSLLTALADCMERNGQHAEAMQQRLRVLHINEANFGIAHENVRQSEEGIALLNRERFGLDAEANFLASRLASVEAALGEQHKRSSDLRSKLMALFEEQGRYVDALPLIKKMIEVAEKNPSSNKDDRAHLLYKLAGIYHGLGRSVEAISIYLNLDSPSCSSSGLVDVYTDLMRYKEAISNYEKCPSNQVVSEKLAYFYRIVGDIDKAIQTYTTLLAHEKGKDYDFQKLFYLYTLADLYRSKGNHTESQSMERKTIQFLPEYLKNEISMGTDESDHVVDVSPLDANQPRLVANTGHSNGIAGMALSADGKQLITAGVGDSVKIWDIATGREIYSFNGPKARVKAFAMSKDGRWMALGSSTGIIEIWDVRSRAKIHVFKAHHGDIETIVFAPDGLTLASTSVDQSIRLWSVKSGFALRSLPAEWAGSRKLIFSPSGKELLTTSDHKIYIWNCATGSLIGTLRKRKWVPFDASSLAFDQSGRVLAVGDGEAIRLWDYKKRTVVRTMYFFSNRGEPAKSLFFSRDGTLLISGHNWGIVRVWDVSSGRELRKFDDAVHAGEPGNLLLLENGTLLTSGEHGNEIRFWNPLTGVQQNEFGGTVETISSIAYSESRQLLATGRWHINFWDMQTGQEKSVQAHDMKIRGIFFSPDGDKLASAGGKQIKVWDVRTEKELWSATTSTNKDVFWTQLDLSPDSKTLISNDYESVKRWEFETGRMLDSWDAPSNIGLWNAFFSTSGQYYVRDNKNIVRDLKTWQPAAVLNCV